jgi:hypothetical protein
MNSFVPVSELQNELTGLHQMLQHTHINTKITVSIVCR